ncbi:hypothetical protein LZ554_000898 [Drepanopeziza brunnea f. sp. 'monogermtubi']|nr:hypothetical protein LZ554_000898 [Drepanopeziza brunnea f. sp. 'monogermtubi']
MGKHRDPYKKKKVRATSAAKKPRNTPALQQSDQDTSDEPLFFFMPNEKHAEFCQWFSSPFTVSKAAISALLGHETGLIDDDNDNSYAYSGTIKFNCAEQFMMYCKAARFHDRTTQAKVLAASTPKEQKRLGKLVNGFDPESWDEVKSSVVLAGSIAKYEQNPELKDKLLATGERLLVEAASKDRVWGTVFTEKHAMSNREHWGENRLGKALMEAREHLRGNRRGVRRGVQTLLLIRNELLWVSFHTRQTRYNSI